MGPLFVFLGSGLRYCRYCSVICDNNYNNAGLTPILLQVFQEGGVDLGDLTGQAPDLGFYFFVFFKAAF
jgi:hypothetical protein